MRNQQIIADKQQKMSILRKTNSDQLYIVSQEVSMQKVSLIIDFWFLTVSIINHTTWFTTIYDFDFCLSSDVSFIISLYLPTFMIYQCYVMISIHDLHVFRKGNSSVGFGHSPFDCSWYFLLDFPLTTI